MAVTEIDRPVSRAARKRRIGLATRFRRDRALIVLTVPGILLMLVFLYLPLLGNIIAFKDYQPSSVSGPARGSDCRISRSSSPATRRSSVR